MEGELRGRRESVRDRKRGHREERRKEAWEGG